MFKVNVSLIDDPVIMNEQAKRIENSFRMHCKVFLKENNIIDFNQVMTFRVYNKVSNQTYSVKIEKPIDDNEPSHIWASCNCPDFMQRIIEKKWDIPCKHIYKSLFAWKDNRFIDLVNRRAYSMSSSKSVLKIDYLDIQCPNCNSHAVVPYSKICSILLQEDQVDDAQYICESCYHAW